MEYLGREYCHLANFVHLDQVERGCFEEEFMKLLVEELGHLLELASHSNQQEQ